MGGGMCYNEDHKGGSAGKDVLKEGSVKGEVL